MNINIKILAAFVLISLSVSLKGQNCIKIAPYLEGFDTIPWKINVGATRDIDTCWQLGRYWNLGLRDFYPWTDIMSCDSSGSLFSSSEDARIQNPKYYLFLSSASAGSPSAYNAVISPWVDITALASPTLYFDYHMYGEDIEKLTISWQAKGDSVWNALDSLVGEHQHSLVDFFKSIEIPLPKTTDTLRIRFSGITKNIVAGKRTYWNRSTIDNFEIAEKEPCGIPQFTGIRNITSRSAEVFWYSTSGANTLTELKYGLHGHVSLPTQGKSLVASGSSLVLPNLQEGQSYRIYLRHICNGDTGRWVDPLLLQTACSNSPRSFPYLQSFEDWGNTLNNLRYRSFFGYKDIQVRECWENKGKCLFPNMNPVFRRNWETVQFDNKVTSGVNGKGMFLEGKKGRNDAEAVLGSPPIDLRGSARPQLSYHYAFPAQGIGDKSIFFVELQRTGTLQWIAIDSIKTPSQNLPPGFWTQRVIPLSIFKNDVIKLRFRLLNPETSSSEIFLDEIHFREKPGCALAGPDSTVQICDSLLSYDLSGLLDSLAMGGFWRDVKGSGALNGTVLNLNQLPQDSAFPFRYVIPADSACTADSATFTLIRNQAGCSIGLEEYKLPGLDIFPNPAGQRLYLRPHNPQLKWGAVALYNLQGQRLPVELSEGAAGQRSLSLAEVPRGVYFVKLELDGKKLVRKIVVEQ